MTLDESIQGIRLRALELPKELGMSVTEACEQLAISRSPFLRWRKRFESYGPDWLDPKRTRAGRGRPSAVAPDQERAVIALALASPTWGPPASLRPTARPRHLEHRQSTAAQGESGYSPPAAGRDRTPQRPHGGASHRAHA